MLKRAVLALLLALAPLCAALAQTNTVPISQLPPATTPLAGTELFPLVQNGVTRQTPVKSIAPLSGSNVSFAQFGKASGYLSSNDDTPAYNAWLAACGASTTRLCYLPTGQYNFRTQPNCLPEPMVIYGDGIGETQLFKNYNSVSPTGLICISSFQGADSTVRDLSIYGTAGTSGGSLISLIGPVGPPIGFTRFENMAMSTTGACTQDYNVYIDGTGNIPAPQGVRATVLNDLDIFGAAVESVHIAGTVGLSWKGSGVYPAGCSNAGSGAIHITGTAAVPSTYINITLSTSQGGFIFDNAHDVTITTTTVGQIGGVSVQNDSSANDVTVVATSFAGTIQGNWVNSQALNLNTFAGGGGGVSTSAQNTWSAIQSFIDGDLSLVGATSGNSVLHAPATSGGHVTFFTGSDTVAGLAATQTLTNKTFGLNDVWNGVTISPAYGGTGVNNGTNTLTVSGNTGLTPGAAGQVGVWSSGTLSGSATPTLGASGTLGSVTMGNVTSGLLTLKPVTGALGTVTVSLPAATDQLVGRATTDILTNKSIAGSEINSGIVGSSVGGTGVNNGANTLTLNGNTALTPGVAGQIGVWSGGALSGSATPTLGASGTLGSIAFGNATSGLLTLAPVTGALGTVTLSLPAATDQLVGRATTDTLTNKSIAASEVNSGQLAVAQGGTGLASGTSGGILGYTATGTLASSAALTANALLLGGGAGATPTAMASLGTTTTVLHGNAAGAPTFGAVSLTTDASGTLAAAQFPALTGDTTTSAGSLATTTSKLNGNTPGVSAVSGSVVTSISTSAVGTLSTLSTVLDSAIGSTQGSLAYRGASTWTALTPGSSGQLLQSGGPSANPSWITASGTGTVTSVATGWGVTGGTITTTGTVSLATANPAAPCEPVNLQINASVASSALTIALKGNNGSDPSATNPVLVCVRDATAANGGPVWLAVTAATSLVVNSGASLGTAATVPFRVWVVGFNDAGTFRLGVINCVAGGALPTSIYPLSGSGMGTVSSTAISGTATAAQTFYSGSAVTSKAYAILGYAEYGSGLTTAGTWATAPTKLQIFNHGVPMPGQIVQSVFLTGGAAANTTSTSMVDVTGSAIAITPTSAANFVKYSYTWNGLVLAAGSGQNSNYVGHVNRGSTTIWGDGTIGVISGAGTNLESIGSMAGTGIDNPATTSSTTYKIQHKTSNAAGQATTSGINGFLEEIMG